MKHTYQIEGMTCGSCVATIADKLKIINGVESITVNFVQKEANVKMNRHISTNEFQEALGIGKFTIQEKKAAPSLISMPISETARLETAEESDLKRLYPLFLIFAYLVGTVLISELAIGEWDGMRAMQHFMGGFFIVFSFFKLLDLNGFASSFQMYDPIAKHSKPFGFLYPFIELGLGVGFLLSFNLSLLSLTTLIILGIGTIGVARTVLNKRKIQCACLGTVFNLPMTKVTIIENSIMIVMAIFMLIVL